MIQEEFEPGRRGLMFLVDEVQVFGSPPERLRVWATLHFLPLGSPFCCYEPGCHIILCERYLDRVNDAIRRRMNLRQTVEIELTGIAAVRHADVEFDDLFSGRTPVDMDAHRIDARDALGRTALMRAAVRGYERQVEELLAAGADPSVVDDRGRGILEQLSGGWIATIIEAATGKRAGSDPERP